MTSHPVQAPRAPRRATDNGLAPALTPPQPYRPSGEPLPDLATYEKFISDALASADANDTTVDHVTARRLAIWLAARPQEPELARGLVRFIATGAIAHGLRNQLRLYTRSPHHNPDRTQAGRLLQYYAARDTPGPIGDNFGSACDQIDRADAQLAGLRQRIQDGRHPQPAQPPADVSSPLALARRDPDTRYITLILDEATANTAIHAITAHAIERETHLREVQQNARSFPASSYARANRDDIAARESRIATRLRTIEHAYRTALERDPTPQSPQPTSATRPNIRAADREIEPG